MTEKHPNLAAALAAFQAELPKIGKDNTATVPTKTGGQYTYKYADLSDVSAAVLPRLAAHGLSFSAKPTLTDDGRFVLAYVLRHDVDGEDAGNYPLPMDGTPQSIGSAISYARRYILSAITGVAPDQDDDGQAATAQHDYSAHRRQAPQQRRQPEPETAAVDETEQADTVGAARSALGAHCKRVGYDIALVGERFAAQYGQSLGEATDPTRVRAFTKLLDGIPGHELGVKAPATNGAAQ